MLGVRFVKIDPAKVEQVRAWMAELGTRRDELQAALRQDTVREEKVFLLDAGTGPILVFVTDNADLAHAMRMRSENQTRIAQDYRVAMRSTVLGEIPAELIFEERVPG
jgi:hypothetical protein